MKTIWQKFTGNICFNENHLARIYVKYLLQQKLGQLSKKLRGIFALTKTI